MVPRAHLHVVPPPLILLDLYPHGLSLEVIARPAANGRVRLTAELPNSERGLLSGHPPAYRRVRERREGVPHDLASADLRDLVLGLYDPVSDIRAGQQRTSDNMELRGEPRVRVGKGLEDVCEKLDEVCLLLR